MVVSGTIHPFPGCPKPARESRLSKLVVNYQCVFRRRRRTRPTKNNFRTPTIVILNCGNWKFFAKLFSGKFQNSAVSEGTHVSNDPYFCFYSPKCFKYVRSVLSYNPYFSQKSNLIWDEISLYKPAPKVEHFGHF